MTHRVIIDANGFVRCIYNPDVPLHELGHVTLRRLSHIRPAHTHRTKRWAFRVLRSLFGDRGRVAQWTRRWRCLWTVEVIACHAYVVFERREDAVRWELKHISECEVCAEKML